MENTSKPLTPKSINKTQIIQVISDRLDVTRIQAARFLEVLGDIAEEALTRDKIFIIPDLVQFAIKETKGRPARRGVGFDKQPTEFPATPPKRKVAAKPVGQIKKVSLT